MNTQRNNDQRKYEHPPQKSEASLGARFLSTKTAKRHLCPIVESINSPVTVLEIEVSVTEILLHSYVDIGNLFYGM